MPDPQIPTPQDPPTDDDRIRHGNPLWGTHGEPGKPTGGTTQDTGKQ